MPTSSAHRNLLEAAPQLPRGAAIGPADAPTQPPESCALACTNASVTSAVALSRDVGEVTLAPHFRGPNFGWSAGARWAIPLAALGVGYALALQGHPSVLFVAGIFSGLSVAACEVSMHQRRRAVQKSARALYLYARSRLGEEHELTLRAKMAATKAKAIDDGATATQLEEGLAYTWELLQQRPAERGLVAKPA